MLNKKNYKLFFSITLLITYFYGKFQGGFVSWFLFYALLILSLYIWLVARYSFKKIKVTRSLSKERLTSGDDLQITIEVWNRHWFPLSYVIVEDDKPLKLKRLLVNNRYLHYPWFRPKTIIKYTIPKVKRGIHQWEFIELVTGDIFGFIQLKQRIPLFSGLMAYPKSFPIIRWGTENKRNVGSVFSQNKLSEDTASVIGVREYRRGDRFNRIHWVQSAKNMQLMTKEFERLITNDFLFFINQEEDVYIDHNHFEKAIELVASLAGYAESKRFSFGLVSSGKLKRSVPPARGKEQMMRIYEVLSIIEADSDIPFSNTILKDTSYLSSNITMVIITPQLNAELVSTIAELAFKKVRVEVFVISDKTELDNQISNTSLFGETTISLHNMPIGNMDISDEGGIKIV